MSKPGSVVSQTVLYGFSIVAMKGISILMLPFIAQRLTQPAFGRLEVLSSLAVVISIIVGLGLEDTRFAGKRIDAWPLFGGRFLDNFDFHHSYYIEQAGTAR